ncbi:hypothetical protein GCM10010528_02020 [Gordonia defluvii]|jgi:hypothetical protein|uniref:Transposase n=1 Tax=Gordonia defluvii TaxID=283718 RepID=A0ABN3YEP3_9ACTN
MGGREVAARIRTVTDECLAALDDTDRDATALDGTDTEKARRRGAAGQQPVPQLDAGGMQSRRLRHRAGWGA